MKFIFLRHCLTDWNSQGRLQGWADKELSLEGRSQALDLSNQVFAMGIDRVVTSDLKRATETGKIIADRLDIPIESDQRLRECKLGSLEGKTWPEIEKVFLIKKEAIYRGADQPYNFRLFGGEDREVVLLRHITILAVLRNRYPGQRILIVGHGTGLNTLLSTHGDDRFLPRGEFREIDL